jgi:hypothetical protein
VKRIKNIPQANKKTISTVAGAVEGNKDFVYKIENRRIISSLPVSLNSINILEITVSYFLEDIPLPTELYYIPMRGNCD